MSRIHLDAFGVDAYRWPVAPAVNFRGEPGEDDEEEDEDEDESDEGDDEGDDDQGDGYSE
jgi:hypothetical protein